MDFMDADDFYQSRYLSLNAEEAWGKLLPGWVRGLSATLTLSPTCRIE